MERLATRPVPTIYCALHSCASCVNKTVQVSAVTRSEGSSSQWTMRAVHLQEVQIWCARAHWVPSMRNVSSGIGCAAAGHIA